MKIVVIVLLIAAIGAGTYLYFGKKQHSSSANSRELIRGKWRIDSLVINRLSDSSQKFQEGWIHSFFDSTLKMSEFEFNKNGLVVRTFNGKPEDSSHYEFATGKGLLIWGNTDTAKSKFLLGSLDSSTLVIQDPDSTRFYFKKLR